MKLIKPLEYAELKGITVQTVYRHVRNGKLKYRKSKDNTLLIVIDEVNTAVKPESIDKSDVKQSVVNDLTPRLQQLEHELELVNVKLTESLEKNNLITDQLDLLKEQLKSKDEQIRKLNVILDYMGHRLDKTEIKLILAEVEPVDEIVEVINPKNKRKRKKKKKRK